MRTVRVDLVVFGHESSGFDNIGQIWVYIFEFESLNWLRIWRRHIHRFWGVLSQSLCRCLRIVDPILEGCLSWRIDGDEDDTRIFVDLRILLHIRNKLADGLSRVCFEWRQQIRHIVVLESLECLWARTINATWWKRQLERSSRSNADLVLGSNLWLRILSDG